MIFYPLIILDALLIFATMGLGYHYLTDVLAGALLAGISILFAKKISIHISRDNQQLEN